MKTSFELNQKLRSFPRTFPAFTRVSRKGFSGLFALLFILGFSRHVQAQSWAATGSMVTGRYWHTLTTLPSGIVLAAAGNGIQGCELYNPSTASWSSTGSMSVGRYLHTATLLNNGKVLVVGGQGSGPSTSCELYNPSTGTWSTTGSLSTGRYYHTATLLNNGKVLVTGGTVGGYVSSCELYDPGTGIWSSTGPLNYARGYHAASLLQNGKVLVTGGFNSSSHLNIAEIYDPSSGSWSTTGTQIAARSYHTSTTLANGNVLLAGGLGSSGLLTSCEIYNPSTGNWSSTGSLPSFGQYMHKAELLFNGEVLIFGGSSSKRSLLYKPSAATWSVTGSLVYDRAYFASTVLNDGRVLTSGGASSYNTAEIYTPCVAPYFTSCPSDMNATANSNCQAVVTYSSSASGTPSPSLSYSFSGATSGSGSGDGSGSVFNAGTTLVTLTASSSCSTAVCSFTVTVTDEEDPIAICQNYTLNLSGGTGTVSPSDINYGSSDNCGIASMTVTPNTFTCSQAGDNTVTLTVTDYQGNSSSCNAIVSVQTLPSCTISVTTSNSTYTGGVATNLYLGYGPQSATLNTTASGGSGFSYSWSPSANLSSATSQNPVFAPTSAGNYTFTVTVTNSNGCSSNCTVQFCVKDVRDPRGSGKIVLCHIPPGSSSTSHLEIIAASAVNAHLTNGCILGTCDNNCRGFGKQKHPAASFSKIRSLEVSASPNPFKGSFTLSYLSPSDSPVEILVYGMTGNRIESIHLSGDSQEVELGKGLEAGVYTVILIQGTESKTLKMVKIE